MLDEIQKRLIAEVADLHEIPEGAYNLRANGETAGRNTTANIDISSKDDKSGIIVRVKPGTKHESVHIPVVLSQSGITEVIYLEDKYADTDGVKASKRMFDAAGVKYTKLVPTKKELVLNLREEDI